MKIAGRAGFFGGLIEGLGGAIIDRKKQQHDEEQQALDRQFKAGMLLFDRGFEDIGADLLGSTISGMFAGPDGKPPKGGKKDGLMGILANPKAVGGLLKGLHKGIGAGAEGQQGQPGASAREVDQIESGNAPAPQRSQFRSREEGEAAAEAADRRKETFRTDESIRSARETGRYNRPTTWSTDTTVGADLKGLKQDILGNDIDPAKKYKTRELSDGTVEARPTEFTSAKATKTDNTKLGQMARRLKVLSPDLSDEDAQKQAAQRLETEDKLTATQKAGRYNAFIKAAGSTELLKGERLTEAQTLFPVHVAAAKAGIDLAQLRISAADARTPQAAAKVLQTFEKTAQQIVGKRTLFQKFLTDDFPSDAGPEQIADQLIKEAGQDPDALRATAKTAYAAPAAARPSSATPANPYR